MIKPDKDWPRGVAPPEPPPMRIGQRGDTISRDGVRRKADGSIRNINPDSIWDRIFFAIFIIAVASIFYFSCR